MHFLISWIDFSVAVILAPEWVWPIMDEAPDEDPEDDAAINVDAAAKDGSVVNVDTAVIGMWLEATCTDKC